MNRIIRHSRISHLMLVISLVVLQQCTSPADHLESTILKESFRSPPDSVRPGVYWTFMDGNLSREAITADLESMKEAGIGQVLIMEVNVGLPRGSVDFLSEEWQNLFKHAVREAERLGIEITLLIGPGWTGSGGPWVQPEQSMVHLMASAVDVNGPSTADLVLPVPDPYQPFFGEESIPENLRKIRNDYYEDVAVLAIPTPDVDRRLKDSDEKALYFRAPYSSAPNVKPFLPFPANSDDSSAGYDIVKEQITDITRFLQPGGRILWEVPSGKWTIMRFGKRNNGAVTRPAPVPGLGFECDKFDTAALDMHLGNFVEKLIRKVEPRKKDSHAGLTMLHMDSWEMSSQNWTGRFREEFLHRRGYDLLPFLPVYTGRIIGSTDISERFLWDIRLTSQELVIENHARRVKEIGRRYGLGLSIEPYDMNPCADLTLGEVADVPMCEFWSKGLGFNTVFSCFEAASLAHVQGLPVVAAEAFTAAFDEAWKQFPGSMKDQGDWAFCAGINRFVYAIFAHKAFGDHLRPGMTMGPYGVHWDRGQTWWPMAKEYHTYISRCSFMLQQGTNVADILYLTPEGAPQVFLPPPSALEGNDTIPDHKAYSFDACSPGMLISKAEVADHRIVFPGGASYSLLVLPAVETMTPELLSTIGQLIEKGATVIGNPPSKSPSLVNYPKCDKQLTDLAGKIWGDLNLSESKNSGIFGKGKVFGGGIFSVTGDKNLYPDYEATASVLKQMGLSEDFSSSGELRFIHRSKGNLDIYFVSNRTGKTVKTDCRFRIVRAGAELWDPLTGTTRILNTSVQDRNGTVIPMLFEPNQSFFVVFDRNTKNRATSGTGQGNFPEFTVISEVSGNWTVSFDTLMGAPAKAKFEQLADWSQNSDKGIKYYSGIARYETTFSLPENPDHEKANQLYLDLGEVYCMARVRLNGEDLGVLWTSPWRIDISKPVKITGNKLEIEVANLWPNRMIGDAFMTYDGQENNKWPEWILKGKPRTSGRYSFTSYDYYKKDAPLLKSGLLGKVRVMIAKSP